MPRVHMVEREDEGSDVDGRGHRHVERERGEEKPAIEHLLPDGPRKHGPHRADRLREHPAALRVLEVVERGLRRALGNRAQHRVQLREPRHFQRREQPVQPNRHLRP